MARVRDRRGGRCGRGRKSVMDIIIVIVIVIVVGGRG
jgi:hypothetical protein